VPVRRRVRGLLTAACFAAVSGAPLAAQSLSCGSGDDEVAALAFVGNTAFSSATLADGIITTPSTWARRTFRIIGTRRCLDRREFALDVVRLLVWYRNHGYIAATVDTVVTPVAPHRLAIRFVIREGAPMVVDSLTIAGLDAVPEAARITRGVATVVGHPFDKYANEQTRDTLTARLRDGGYPDAEVFVGYDTRVADRRASVAFTVVPGRRFRIGAVTATVAPQPGATRTTITPRSVLGAASLASGALYAERELARVKRTLYQTEAFAHVDVVADSAPAVGDSTIAVRLDVTEGLMRAARLGGGWGSLDCIRTTGDLTQQNFLGGIRRLSLRAQVSKIGVGRPLNGLEALCPQAKNDTYSKDLNYSVGATLTQPPLFRDFTPSLALYSERRSEYNAFLRTTPVGGSVALSRARGGLSQNVSFTAEYGRTEAQPALLCAVFNACVEADRESYGRLQRLGVASVSIARDASDDPTNPTSGSVLRLEYRTAGAYTGSDPRLRFNKLLADGSVYWSASPSLILAARARFGAVVGGSLSFSNAALFVPPQERLFAGGPSTVRGFPQNELGPAAYIPSAYDTVRADGRRGGDPANPADTVYYRARADSGGRRVVPTGGNALVVLMLEARMRSPLFSELVQFATFADVGEVWTRGNSGASLGVKSLQWTPGIGVRVRTLIGYVRLDWAYNPNQRPPGGAYFDTPLSAGGALFCVSPGNTLRVTTVGGIPRQAVGTCPATYQPARETGFLRRTNLSFAIGQAF
jgi:outer membrane protein assembly factor BamA